MCESCSAGEWGGWAWTITCSLTSADHKLHGGWSDREWGEKKSLLDVAARSAFAESFESQIETHQHHAAKTLGWLFQSGGLFTVGSMVMFPSVCHLPLFPLGFYILLLAWYLPYPSVWRIPLSSFSWLTNEMLFLAMLLSLSFIAQLHFPHFHLLFFSGSSVATVFTVTCPSPHWDFFGQLLLLSSVISLPAPYQLCPSLLHLGLFYHLTESFSHLPPSSTSLFSYAKDPLSNNHKVNKRTKALPEGYSSYLKIAL